MKTKVTLKHIVSNPDPLGKDLNLNDPYERDEYIAQVAVKAVKDWIQLENIFPRVDNCPNCGHDLRVVYSANNGEDPLLCLAKEFIIASNKVSASALQRKFKIGYSRAAQIIDDLEEMGIVSAADGVNPRTVLS